MEALATITGTLVAFTIALMVFLIKAHCQIEDLKEDLRNHRNFMHVQMKDLTNKTAALLAHSKLDKTIFLSNAEQVKEFINNSEKPLRVTRNEIYDEDNNLIAIFTT